MRFRSLDGLRGLAALSVVLYHYLFRYNLTFGHDFVPWAITEYLAHGVRVFFVISGFVIFMTLEKIEQPMDFVASRVARLYPAFWACCTITWLVVSVFGLENREVGFTDYLVNLTMIQEYVDFPNVDGVYWTLTVELAFYFLMLMLLVLGQLKNILWYLAGWMVLAIFPHSVSGLLAKLLILEYAPWFALGIILYKMNAGRVIIRLNWLASAPLVLLGSISYNLYLVHQNLGYIIINKFGTLGIPIALLVSVVVAYGVREIFEIPGGRLLKNGYRMARIRFGDPKTTI